MDIALDAVARARKGKEREGEGEADFIGPGYCIITTVFLGEGCPFEHGKFCITNYITHHIVGKYYVYV